MVLVAAYLITIQEKDLAFHQVANNLSFLRRLFSNTERVNSVIVFGPDRALYPNKKPPTLENEGDFLSMEPLQNFYPAVIVKRPRLTLCDPSAV